MAETNPPQRFKYGDRVCIHHSEMRGPIVEVRGPFGPGGAQIYRVRIRRKPPAYIDVREDQLELISAESTPQRGGKRVGTPLPGETTAIQSRHENMADTYTSRLVDHYGKTWGRHAYEARWSKGPTHELPSSFRVLVFGPTRERGLWVYATCGMSDADDKSALELHLLSPSEYSGHIELLTVVAHYHRTGHPLGAVGSTVNFGRPWMPGSNLTHGLISRPYRDGPSLEVLAKDGENGQVDCEWLLPITKDERDYKKLFGLEKLETLFGKHGLQYADPMRPSVI
jgi:hypothetical protein